MGGEIKEPGTSMKGTSTGLETKAWATHLARGACVGKGGATGAGTAAAHREGSGLGRALAGVSSACSLWGGQLSRPEETERSLWNTYYVKQVLGLIMPHVGGASPSGTSVQDTWGSKSPTPACLPPAAFPSPFAAPQASGLGTCFLRAYLL